MQNNLDMKIAVFCSANDSIAPAYFKAAEELGKWMADSGHTLVYGGQIIGVIPQILANSGQRPDSLDVEIPCDNLSDRKDLMLAQADVCVALPGGVGTLDEVFTVAASHSIGYHCKEAILYNVEGFWDKVIEMLDDMQRRGFMRGHWTDYIKVVENLEELKAAIL